MAEILPAILANSEEEFIKLVDHVRSLGLMLHIDIMDGAFVPATTWAPPERMRELLEGIRYEAHLMVTNPEHLVPVWIAAGADRVIFHAESTERVKLICHAVVPHCDRLCVAINPDTPVSHIMPHLDILSQVLVMGVVPGKAGQSLQDIALHKVRALKEVRPSLRVGVDGGVKLSNAPALIEAGCDFLVVGSALTGHPNPYEAAEEFRTAIGSAPTLPKDLPTPAAEEPIK